MTTWFVATGNRHKVGEIATGLGDGARVLSLADTGARLEPEETGSTFAANARIKALTWAAFLATDLCDLGVDWVLADDSGLEVDALGGAPGMYSARFAALDDGRPGNSPDAENNAKLLRLLVGIPAERRLARFRCVLAAVPVLRGESPESMAAATRFFEGICEGTIGTAPRGTSGFGYDPLFMPAGEARSFAELGPDFKDSRSHRAQALARLREAWTAAAG
ncbi:MAG: non-canonical purine NTP pyrophosphatase [Verrucomicrobiota bacterium]